MTKAPTPNQNPGIRLRMFACLLIAGWYLHASNLAQGSFRTLTSFPEELIASKVENRANLCRNIRLGNVFTKLSLAAKPSRAEYCTSCTVSWDSSEVRLVNNNFNSRPSKLIRLISNWEVGNVNSVSIFFSAVWLFFVNLKVFNFDIGILRALCNLRSTRAAVIRAGQNLIGWYSTIVQVFCRNRQYQVAYSVRRISRQIIFVSDTPFPNKEACDNSSQTSLKRQTSY